MIFLSLATDNIDVRPRTDVFILHRGAVFLKAAQFSPLSCPERFDRLVSTDGLEIPFSLRDERAIYSTVRESFWDKFQIPKGEIIRYRKKNGSLILVCSFNWLFIAVSTTMTNHYKLLLTHVKYNLLCRD